MRSVDCYDCWKCPQENRVANTSSEEWLCHVLNDGFDPGSTQQQWLVGNSD